MVRWLSKRQTIGNIMETMEEGERKNLENWVEKGIAVMGRKNLDWKQFKVFPSSVDNMKIVLHNPAFIFAIIATLKEDYARVNIAIRIKCSESRVYTRRINDSEIIAIVQIAEREMK